MVNTTNSQKGKQKFKIVKLNYNNYFSKLLKNKLFIITYFHYFQLLFVLGCRSLYIALQLTLTFTLQDMSVRIKSNSQDSHEHGQKSIVFNRPLKFLALFLRIHQSIKRDDWINKWLNEWIGAIAKDLHKYDGYIDKCLWQSSVTMCNGVCRRDRIPSAHRLSRTSSRTPYRCIMHESRYWMPHHLWAATITRSIFLTRKFY